MEVVSLESDAKDPVTIGIEGHADLWLDSLAGNGGLLEFAKSNRLLQIWHENKECHEI